MSTPTGSARDGSLDGFRGFTVVLMVIVNLQVAQVAWSPLAHAPWHGLTLADLVFPWFLLIVGLSVPLAQAARRSGGSAALRRAALLFVIGVALAWLIRPTTDSEAVRWMGVLQRIALVYLACVAVASWSTGWLAPAVLALVLLVGHGLLLLSPPPGEAASLAAGQGMSGWLDRALLPGRLYPPGWDPEGILSTLGALASGSIGVALMRVSRSRAMPGRTIAAVGIALSLAGAAIAALGALPFNKALWTPSFGLVTAGLGALVWIGMRRVGPVGQDLWPARLLMFCGRTALTIYVVHMLLIALLVRTTADGERLWDMGYAPFHALGPMPTAASLAFSLVGTALAIGVTALLARRGLVLRL